MAKRRFYSMALTAAVLISPVFAFGQGVKVSGSVTERGSASPVGFATVVAMKADSTVAGATVAGEDGKYLLELAGGNYILNVSCIGFEPTGRNVACLSGSVSEDFSLDPSATTIEQVSVRAPKIVRESDRFVVNVAGSLDAVGKNAEELLKTAPAVWIREDKILVDGRSGAQIIVNDRVLNMNDEQTIAYLRSINAEDIARVEVIPRGGADRDAAASGGVIKITLRKKCDAGLEISPATRMTFGDGFNSFRNSITINYRTGKFAFYTHGYNDHFKTFTNLEEHEQNPVTKTSIDSRSGVRGRMHNGGGRFGVIYDISEKQSVGAEYADYFNNNYTRTVPYTLVSAPDPFYADSSRYYQVNKPRNHYAAVNYILRLDSLGSVFKIIGDVSSTKSLGDNTFRNRKTFLGGPEAGSRRDTLYRNDSDNRYLIATATASLEQVLSSKTRLQTGMKFVYTSLDDDSRYLGNISGEDWKLDRRYSVKQRYTEKIGAAYATISSGIGPVRYTLGLRGEYTHATPVTSLFDGTPAQKNRNTYFSLFPNVNLSVPLKEDKGHSVSVFYARKISRPGYWALNPFRMQVSELSYIIGDPMLKPAYINEAGATVVLKHKYTLTGGYRGTKDRIEQYVTKEGEMTVYRHMNLANERNVFVSLNLPVDFTDKISMNGNVYMVHSRMDPGNGGSKIISNNAFVNATFNLTLPHTYRLEVVGWYMSGERWGNMKVKAMGDVNLAVRKRFIKDALSAAVEIRNILEFKSHQRMTVEEAGFRRELHQDQSWNKRSVMVSLQYNFKTGIKANGRHVERGGDDSR